MIRRVTRFSTVYVQSILYLFDAMKTSTLVVCATMLIVAAGSARADAVFRPGDTFELRLGGVPADEGVQVSSTYTIDGGGGLNLPYIGKLTVAGMNSSQVQSVVERTYIERGIYTHPSITLVVQAQARFVNVGGHVKAPQRVNYTPDMTLLSAINAAGDFDDFADQRKVRLIRGQTVKIVDCKQIRKNPANDVQVLPGDQIQVPEGFW